MPKPFYRHTETSAPGAEPLTLAEAKAHLRVTQDAEDDLIAALIKAARQLCESVTGRAFITRDISLFLDRWPDEGIGGWWDGVREGAAVTAQACALELPKPPLYSVTEILVYDSGDAAATYQAANYFVDASGSPGRIVLRDAAYLPQPGRSANGIEVRYKAGYGASAAALPAPLREAVKQAVAHFYENRGDAAAAGLPAGALALLQPYRMTGLS